MEKNTSAHVEFNGGRRQITIYSSRGRIKTITECNFVHHTRV